MTIKTILRKNNLTKDLNEDIINFISDNAKSIELEKGNVLQTEKGLKILVRGSLKVIQQNVSGDYLINRLSANSIFGMANLFSECGSCNIKIISETNCRIIIIPEKICLELVKNYNDFAVKLISLMSAKIRFLTVKISEVSADSAELALSKFLLENNGYHGNISELALRLNIVRSSLYKSLESLENKKIILRNKKDICVINIDELKQYIENGGEK